MPVSESFPAVNWEQLYRQTRRFGRELDERIEEAQANNQSLAESLPALLALTRQALGSPVFLIARGDDLAWRPWTDGIDEGRLKQLLAFAVTGLLGPPPQPSGLEFRCLDLFGRSIGLFGWESAAEEAGCGIPQRQELAHVFCEQLDNYLFAENCSRQTHAMKLRIGELLKNRLFARGLENAVQALREAIDFNALILVYHDENDPVLASLKYFIWSEAHGYFDPYHHFQSETHRWITEHAPQILGGRDPELLERFAIVNYQEQFLLSGLKDATTIGKLIVSSGTSRFDVLEQEILQVFIAFIQQRVLDFNKEWRNLSQTFSVNHRVRLLEHEAYESHFLSPRVRQVATLFADISSFTHFSEQVLGEPELITQLFDTWAGRVMALVWQYSGCCDKFVGDCVIAHFGPPFYEESDEENCRRALACAQAIREFTLSLLERPEPCFRAIAACPAREKFGVACGLNFGRVNIGIIGPNRDFTAFGADMNNTARIQGQARCNEILLLTPFARLVEPSAILEGPFRAHLKNVRDEAEYYRFAAWRDSQS